MRLIEIAARSFRNLSTDPVFFGDGVTLITGENAQGKTNLLEAVAVLCGQRSFRRVRPQEMALTGKPLSVELAKETLKDIVGAEENRAVPSEIIKTVAAHYGLRVSDMKAKSNAKPIAFPRQVAMYLCRKLTGLSYPEIGRLFNDKHHSTVMHSVEKIERLIEDDANFRKVIDAFVQPYR